MSIMVSLFLIPFVLLLLGQSDIDFHHALGNLVGVILGWHTHFYQQLWSELKREEVSDMIIDECMPAVVVIFGVLNCFTVCPVLSALAQQALH